MIHKTVTLQSINDATSNVIEVEEDMNPHASELVSLFKFIYNEAPLFWDNGLYSELFNGVGDSITGYKSKGRLIGFVAVQMSRPTEDESSPLGNYICMGFLPEFRGHGLATKAVSSFILNKNLDDLCWACHKDNIASQRLFIKVAKAIKKPIKLIFD